jgi:hypothetical protein
MRASSLSIRLCALTLAAILATAAPAAAQVYSNDFESNTAGFSTSNRILLPTTNAGLGSSPNSQFLGPFSNGSTTLGLTGLTAGVTYGVSFDFFAGGSWDGNNANSVGPDHFRLTTTIPSTLLDTTFANTVPHLPAEMNTAGQSYSDLTPTGAHFFPAYSGADVARTDVLEPDFFLRYAIYYFGHGAGNPTLQFTATGPTATLAFTAFGLQTIDDEYWALDNVSVSAIPEPATSVLLLCALALTSRVTRQRRL